MGPVVVAIEVLAIATTAGVLGETVAIEVIQDQIKSKIKEHQKQFDALKDIQTYLKELLQQADISIEDELFKDALFQNMSQIQAFIQTTKENFNKLVNNYPKELTGYIVPTGDQEKKILAVYNKENGLQNVNYLISKSISLKEQLSFIAASLDISTMIQGVDWEEIKTFFLGPGLLIAQLGISVFTLKGFLATGRITAGVVFGSILSAIGLVFNIYSIVDNANELQKLVDQKDQIEKEIGKLPKTEVDTMNAIKGSLSSFLAFLVVGGGLIIKIRQKLQFVAIFTTNSQIKQQLKDVLNTTLGPHDLITLDVVQQTQTYAAQLLQLYKGGIDQNNVKGKILQADKIFINFFRNVHISQIHTNLISTFVKLQSSIKKANEQFKKMKQVVNFSAYVINVIGNPNFTDQITNQLIKSYYETLFHRLEANWTDLDRLRIVTCVAGMKQKYFADDVTGETYFGYRLADYRSDIKSYADVGQINTHLEDITEYEATWMAQHSYSIISKLKETWKQQKIFTYYRSTLNFHGVNPLSSIQLQVNKSMFYMGQKDLYRVDCGLEQTPTFICSIWTGEKFADINKEKYVKHSSTLQRGQTLRTDQFLKLNVIPAPGIIDTYYAVMQRDGNLVIYNGFIGSAVRWASQTQREPGSYYLVMQYDGNLVIYNRSGVAIWQTNTLSPNNPNYHLVLQQDGHLRIRDQQNNQIWATQ